MDAQGRADPPVRGCRVRPRVAGDGCAPLWPPGRPRRAAPAVPHLDQGDDAAADHRHCIRTQPLDPAGTAGDRRARQAPAPRDPALGSQSFRRARSGRTQGRHADRPGARAGDDVDRQHGPPLHRCRARADPDRRFQAGDRQGHHPAHRLVEPADQFPLGVRANPRAVADRPGRLAGQPAVHATGGRRSGRPERFRAC